VNEFYSNDEHESIEKDNAMTRNIVSTTTEDGETYSYIYAPAFATEIKRLVMADAWNNDLSLSLHDAKSICQRIVGMELSQMKNEPERKNVKAEIRWAIIRDLPAMVAIENASYDMPWSEKDFTQRLRDRNVIGLVAEAYDHRVVGLMIYELKKKSIEILNIAISPEFRRNGIASMMLDNLKRKLSSIRRTRLSLIVREANLNGQLFFQANGFVATSILDSCYEDSDESGYLMQFDHKEAGVVTEI
jgi:[ribosomal protein S18]-alanine N-acetyltransferase